MTNFACDQTLSSNFQGKDQIGSAKYLKKKIRKEIAIFSRIFYSLFDELFNYAFITVKIFKNRQKCLILRNFSKRYFRSIGTESVLPSFFSKSFVIFAKDNTSNSRENSFLLKKNQFSTEILIFLTPLNISIRFFKISNFFNIIESIRSNGCNSNNFGIVSIILKWSNNFHENRFSTRSKHIKNHLQISEEPQYRRTFFVLDISVKLKF